MHCTSEIVEVSQWYAQASGGGTTVCGDMYVRVWFAVPDIYITKTVITLFPFAVCTGCTW